MPVTLQITEAQADRLAKLAAEAGSTPEAMLPYVLEDGFDFTEATIRKINAAITEADAGGRDDPPRSSHGSPACRHRSPCRQESGLSGGKRPWANSKRPWPGTPNATRTPPGA